jgi:phage baseplate assembly protein W
MVNSSSIFGRGLSYPFKIDSTSNRPAIASEETLVKMSIAQILKTRTWERPFLVRNGVPFGTQITDALFEDGDAAEDIVKYESKRALDTWEPRIVVLGVTTTQTANSSGGVTIEAKIRFKYRSTNREDNFVLPFRSTNPDAQVG